MTLTRRHIDGTAARSLLERSKSRPLTYDTVGMSLGGEVPRGFREFTAGDVVGSGEDAYRRIGYELMHWGLHRRAGFFVQPEFSVVRAGDAVAVAVGVGPVAVAAACRVVEVVATGRTIGFAYGSLPGHPEIGEESFLLTHGDDDQVRIAVRGITRPGPWYVRLGAPVGRWVQRRAARRFVAGARAAGQASQAVAVIQ